MFRELVRGKSLRHVALTLPVCLFACTGDSTPGPELRGPRAHQAAAEIQPSEAAAFLRPAESLHELVTVRSSALAAPFAVVVASTPTAARSFAIVEGQVVSTEAAWRSLADARAVAFGRMTERLYAQQVERDVGDSIEFDVVVRSTAIPSTPPYDGTDILVSVGEFENHLRATRDARAVTLRQDKARVLEWLEAQGAHVEDRANLPILHVVAETRVLRDAFLHTDPDVLLLSEAEAEPPQALGFAGHESAGLSSFTGGLCGGAPCNGSALGVRIWEYDFDDYFMRRFAIATSNNRLVGAGAVTYQEAPTTCSVHSDCSTSGGTPESSRCVSGICTHEHLSYVSGSFGMAGGSFTYPAGELGPGPVTINYGGTHNTYRYVGNTRSNSSYNWLLGQSLSYVNRSFSGVTAADAIAMDYGGRIDNTLTTIAAGNDANIPGSQVKCGSPSWNVLCVGMYRYETYNNGSTHRRHSLGTYLNLSSPAGQERPHLLGPGSHQESDGFWMPNIQAGAGMVSTFLNGGQIVGSSFAAPEILSMGMQTQLYEGLFSLMWYPVMKKAVLMASSQDSNADGQIGKGTTWTSSPDGEDGAGHPHLLYAKQILDNNRYALLSLTNSSFVSCGANCREYTYGSISVPAFKTLRVAMAYNSCVSAFGGPDNLSNDLDLVVFQPPFPIGWCGGSAIQSVSANNEVEMVYDSCLSSGGSGNYTVKVRIKNGANLALCGSESWENVALAWSIR